MTKESMKKYKPVAWLSVIGVLGVTAITLFALARSAAHAAPSAPNSINITSVTADEQGRAQGDITYQCSPNSPFVSVVLFVRDHDAGIASGVGIKSACDGNVHAITLFISGKDGKFYSLRDHVNAIAALVDDANAARGGSTFDKEDVTL